MHVCFLCQCDIASQQENSIDRGSFNYVSWMSGTTVKRQSIYNALFSTIRCKSITIWIWLLRYKEVNIQHKDAVVVTTIVEGSYFMENKCVI